MKHQQIRVEPSDVAVPEPDDRAETTAPDSPSGRTAGADDVLPPARCGTMFLAMQALRDAFAAHTPER